MYSEGTLANSGEAAVRASREMSANGGLARVLGSCTLEETAGCWW